jgi:hypothetical protein
MTTRSSVPSRSRAAEWTVAAAQYGFTLLYALCGYLALAHAADLTGHWHIPVRDDAFTATVDINAGWGWSFVVDTVLQLGPILAGIGLLVSAMVFLLGRTRGNRALTNTLLGATIATVLTLVVSLTPAAQSLSGWLLD